MLLLCTAAACGGAQEAQTRDEVEAHGEVEARREVETPTDVFERRGFAGTAAVILASGEERCFGECEVRFGPASTFKVPHALIALDAGVLEGPDTLFEWDGQERALPRWNQDHTLQSAIRDSVVWYFQRVAPLVGRRRFEESLRRFDYGDGRVGTDITTFWLDDSLRISPIEQARFWQRFHRAELGVSEQARRQVLDMTILARDDSSVLRGKTGWHPSEPVGGWFVGSLENSEGVATVAVRLTAGAGYDTDAFLAARRLVAEDLLQQLAGPTPE